jgi:hypothetical protein
MERFADARFAADHDELCRLAVEAGGTYNVLRGMTNTKVLLLSVNYLGIVAASLGLLLFIRRSSDHWVPRP